MSKHPNFYENVQEARMRLRRTIVLYDGVPHFVHDVSDHKNDGKIRAYIEEIGGPNGLSSLSIPGFPHTSDYHPSTVGEALDIWMKNNSNNPVKRKELGSPYFNKFRPFPVGNVNTEGKVVYVERTPTRNTYQGLREESIIPILVSVAPDREDKPKGRSNSYMRNRQYPVSIYSDAFKQAVMGCYPSADQVVEGLRNPDVLNDGVAFHREFSIFRGPLDFMFLCYKHQGVGLLDNGDLSKLTLSNEFRFLVEQLEELNIFNNIDVKGVSK